MFESLRSLLGLVFANADATVEEIRKFVIETRHAEFLFGRDAADYLERVRENAFELRALSDKLHERGLPVGEERSKAAKAEGELLKWFVEQAQSGARAKFAPYIRFGMLK